MSQTEALQRSNGYSGGWPTLYSIISVQPIGTAAAAAAAGVGSIAAGWHLPPLSAPRRLSSYCCCNNYSHHGWPTEISPGQLHIIEFSYFYLGYAKEVMILPLCVFVCQPDNSKIVWTNFDGNLRRGGMRDQQQSITLWSWSRSGCGYRIFFEDFFFYLGHGHCWAVYKRAQRFWWKLAVSECV